MTNRYIDRPCVPVPIYPNPGRSRPEDLKLPTVKSGDFPSKTENKNSGIVDIQKIMGKLKSIQETLTATAA